MAMAMPMDKMAITNTLTCIFFCFLLSFRFAFGFVCLCCVCSCFFTCQPLSLGISGSWSGPITASLLHVPWPGWPVFFSWVWIWSPGCCHLLCMFGLPGFFRLPRVLALRFSVLSFRFCFVESPERYVCLDTSLLSPRGCFSSRGWRPQCRVMH